jgi:hypothetical protein
MRRSCRMAARDIRRIYSARNSGRGTTHTSVCNAIECDSERGLQSRRHSAEEQTPALGGSTASKHLHSCAKVQMRDTAQSQRNDQQGNSSTTV